MDTRCLHRFIRCINAGFFLQEHVHDFEQFVADHQQYNDAYNSCVEWLNNIQEKLFVCADVAGDRHTIQSRLDKIQVEQLLILKSLYLPIGHLR